MSMKIARTFLLMEDGLFFWIDAQRNHVNIQLMTDEHLDNSISFLYKWAGDAKENRNLELSILRCEEERREKVRKTEAGKLLYAN